MIDFLPAVKNISLIGTAFVRDNDIDGGALDGTIEIQFAQTSYADAEVANNLTLLFRVEVEL